MTRFITITSGKGGVGKTNFSVNLALHLSKTGKRVCLFDADLGLANINILLNVYPERTLKDAILGDTPIEDIMIHYDDGFDILPGSSGVEEMVTLDPDHIQKFIHSFSQLTHYDFFLFDTSAGITKDVIAFCMASPEVLVLITPEPTSLTDSYSLVKVLSMNGFKGKIQVIVNQCKSGKTAKLAFGKFQSAAEKFLHIDLHCLGVIDEDPKVPQAISQQKPLLTLYPMSNAAACIRKIAVQLAAATSNHAIEANSTTFWEECLRFFKEPITLGRKIKKGKELKIPEKPKDACEPAAGKTGDAPRETETVPKNEPVLSDVSVSPEPPPEAISPVNDEAVQLTRKVVETLSAISGELKGVRQSIERLGPLLSQAGRPGILPPAAGKIDPISLDFQTFLKKRGESGKDL